MMSEVYVLYICATTELTKVLKSRGFQIWLHLHFFLFEEVLLTFLLVETYRGSPPRYCCMGENSSQSEGTVQLKIHLQNFFII